MGTLIIILGILITVGLSMIVRGGGQTNKIIEYYTEGYKDGYNQALEDAGLDKEEHSDGDRKV